MPAQATLIDFALHPPLGLLTPHSDTTGPYSGLSNTLTTFSGSVPVQDTYGVYVTPDTVPSPWGLYLGWNGPGSETGDIWVPRIGQLVVQHQLSSGLWVTTQMTDIVQVGQLILWDVAIPGRIGLAVEPECTMQLYYLRIG